MFIQTKSIHKSDKRICPPVNKVIDCGDKGGAMMAAYARYAREALQGPSLEIRPHGGSGVPKKSVKRTAGKNIANEATEAPAGGSDGSSDDDGGDGDGDGDGPRQPSPLRIPSLSAARRKKTPIPVIRHVCAWATILALLFPYYQLGLSAFLAERGHVDLAREILRFKPTVLVQPK